VISPGPVRHGWLSAKPLSDRCPEIDAKKPPAMSLTVAIRQPVQSTTQRQRGTKSRLLLEEIRQDMS
jgi:hypothetical protein